MVFCSLVFFAICDERGIFLSPNHIQVSYIFFAMFLVVGSVFFVKTLTFFIFALLTLCSFMWSGHLFV